MIGIEIFLERLLGNLRKAEIAYMISGSFSSSFYGQPRATNDIDLVVEATAERIEKFCSTLQGCYVDVEEALEGLRNRTMFNIIDHETGWKVDLIFRKDRPYSRCEFDRRVTCQIMGLEVVMVSVEDTILSKLEWARKSSSSVQYKDALSVAAIQWNTIDKQYLQTWASDLGVIEEMKRLLQEAENFQ